jgi:hypothetical protein
MPAAITIERRLSEEEVKELDSFVNKDASQSQYKQHVEKVLQMVSKAWIINLNTYLISLG